MFNSFTTVRNRRFTAALVGAAALLAACSSDAATTAGSASTVSTDASSTTTGDTTASSTVDTTTPASTPATAAPSTLPPDPLVLRSDGLGPFDFGAATSAVIDAITAQFGPPASNDLVLYEDASHLSEGYYRTLIAPYYFALGYPVGRTACWTGEFCAEFGGASDATLTFIGWHYTGPPHMFASASNLTIGAKWEDFPSMIVGATCYTTGGGTHHDIYMVLEVDGGWDWLVSDGAGGWVEQLPDPAITRVTFLSAGEAPFEPELDC